MKITQMKLALFTIITLLPLAVLAQNYDTNGDYVQTFAGSGFYGYLDGVGQLTMFNNPNQIVSDSHSNLFVWDANNYRVRKISPDGTVTTFAGGGTQVTGVGTNVNLMLIVNGMAIDRNDTIWMSTGGSGWHLYEIKANASITRTNFSSFSSSSGICADSLGNLYMADMYNNRIYRFSTNGVVSVFAGSGNPGHADGNGVFTSFYYPDALAVDAADNIYVWDSANNLIRRIDQNQNVTTFAGDYGYSINADGIGTNASFQDVGQMCFDRFGNLFLACLKCIRKIDAQTNVTTMAGSFGQTGYTNGLGNLAAFNGASGVCLSGGTVFVADSGNERIRNITFNPLTQPVLPANLQLTMSPTLRITGIVGRTYQIQASADMTNWNTVATILLNSSPYLWIDQNPVIGNKFYRALLTP